MKEILGPTEVRDSIHFDRLWASMALRLPAGIKAVTQLGAERFYQITWPAMPDLGIFLKPQLRREKALCSPAITTRPMEATAGEPGAPLSPGTSSLGTQEHKKAGTKLGLPTAGQGTVGPTSGSLFPTSSSQGTGLLQSRHATGSPIFMPASGIQLRAQMNAHLVALIVLEIQCALGPSTI